MENISDKIVHKLWMIDHHTNEPEHIREFFHTIHFSWLRENLDELDVNSAHIKIEHLREFAIATLFEHGWIYKYNPSPKKCLMPVKKDHSKNKGLSVVPAMKNGSKNFHMRDFAANTLPKNGIDTVLKEKKIICELRDFAAETLSKNGTDKNFRVDTLFSPITEPENMAILKPKFHEKIENFRVIAFFTSF